MGWLKAARPNDDESNVSANTAEPLAVLEPQPTPTDPPSQGWAIRPDQALRWAAWAQTHPSRPSPVLNRRGSSWPLRFLAVLALVVGAGLAGGLGAYAIVG